MMSSSFAMSIVAFVASTILVVCMVLADVKRIHDALPPVGMAVSIEDVRRRWSTGDILLFRSSNSSWISSSTVMQYTHIGIVVDGKVVEAHGKGDGRHLGNGASGVFAYDVEARVRTYPGTVHWSRLRAPRDQERDARIRRAVRRLAERKYDFDHVAWLVSSCSLRVPLVRPNDVVFCSELVVDVLQRAGLVSTDIDASCVCPDDVAAMPLFDAPRPIFV